MGQLTIYDIAERAERGQDLGIRRRPSRAAQREAEVTIAEKFAEFHSQNPEVYTLIVSFAREAKDSGMTTYGIASIFEQIRWHHNIRRKDRDFKLNNNFRSHYSRLIEKQEADLADFFTKRQMQDEDL